MSTSNVQRSADAILEEIIQELRALQPYRVILFGSYAWGHPHRDSDIDLVVVLDKHDAPSSFEERLDHHHRVRKQLRTINETWPLDLLVYTRPEWDHLVKLGSSFVREILDEGRVLV